MNLNVDSTATIVESLIANYVEPKEHLIRPVSLEEIPSFPECDYDKNPTKLFMAIEGKRWKAVAYFLRSGTWPGEFHADPIKPASQTCTWVTKYETSIDGSEEIGQWTQLPIHAALIHGAPDDVIKILLDICPGTVRCGDDRKMLPLHLAFHHRASDATLNTIVDMFPQAISSKNFEGKTPVECALSGPHPERSKVIKTIFQKKEETWTKKEKKLEAKQARQQAKIAEVKESLKAKSKEVTNLTDTVDLIKWREDQTKAVLMTLMAEIKDINGWYNQAEKKQEKADIVEDLATKLVALQQVAEEMVTEATSQALTKQRSNKSRWALFGKSPDLPKVQSEAESISVFSVPSNQSLFDEEIFLNNHIVFLEAFDPPTNASDSVAVIKDKGSQQFKPKKLVSKRSLEANKNKSYQSPTNDETDANDQGVADVWDGQADEEPFDDNETKEEAKRQHSAPVTVAEYKLTAEVPDVSVVHTILSDETFTSYTDTCTAVNATNGAKTPDIVTTFIMTQTQEPPTDAITVNKGVPLASALTGKKEGNQSIPNFPLEEKKNESSPDLEKEPSPVKSEICRAANAVSSAKERGAGSSESPLKSYLPPMPPKSDIMKTRSSLMKSLKKIKRSSLKSAKTNPPLHSPREKVVSNRSDRVLKSLKKAKKSIGSGGKLQRVFNKSKRISSKKGYFSADVPLSNNAYGHSFDIDLGANVDLCPCGSEASSAPNAVKLPRTAKETFPEEKDENNVMKFSEDYPNERMPDSSLKLEGKSPEERIEESDVQCAEKQLKISRNTSLDLQEGTGCLEKKSECKLFQDASISNTDGDNINSVEQILSEGRSYPSLDSQSASRESETNDEMLELLESLDRVSELIDSKIKWSDGSIEKPKPEQDALIGSACSTEFPPENKASTSAGNSIADSVMAGSAVDERPHECAARSCTIADQTAEIHQQTTLNGDQIVGKLEFADVAVNVESADGCEPIAGAVSQALANGTAEKILQELGKDLAFTCAEDCSIGEKAFDPRVGMTLVEGCIGCPSLDAPMEMNVDGEVELLLPEKFKSEVSYDERDDRNDTDNVSRTSVVSDLRSSFRGALKKASKKASKIAAISHKSNASFGRPDFITKDVPDEASITYSRMGPEEEIHKLVTLRSEDNSKLSEVASIFLTSSGREAYKV